MPWSTSPRRPTSTVRSRARAFVATNVAGVQVLLQACLGPGSGRWCRFPPTRCTGAWRRAPGPSRRRCSRTRRTRPPRPAATCSPGPTPAPTGWTSGSPAAATTTAPTSIPEKVIPLFITNLLDGLRVPLYGDGRNVRHWVHVATTAGASSWCWSAAPGRCLSHRRRPELSNLELTDASCAAVASGWDMVEHVPDRKGHDRRYALDDSTAARPWLCPGRRFRAGPGHDHALVPGQPPVVGAAQAAAAPRWGRRRTAGRTAADQDGQVP